MPRSHHFNSGFTLIEMLMVISLMTICAGLALSGGIDTYSRALARSDRALLMGALREARAESMAGVCNGQFCTGPVPHGVFVSPKLLTIFEGSSYAARSLSADARIPFSQAGSVGTTSEVVFAAVTGASSLPFLGL
jgi:prepilin-type N-terminal cleavage/methylation domain-containing protein